nr:MAG TPA: hypothetical protein [Caudoviricetes sp.]
MSNHFSLGLNFKQIQKKLYFFVVNKIAQMFAFCQ